MITLLAVDDNPDNLVVLDVFLSEAFPGCRIIKSLNGKDGIASALSELPDVILLDIIMPDMDGFEVCSMLKSDESVKHIPVIILTAAGADKEIRIRSLHAGADAFLGKPVDEIELKAQVSAMLRIKESEDKLRSESEHLARLVEDKTIELGEKLKDQKRVEKNLRATLKKLERSRIASLKMMEDLKSEIDNRKKSEEELSVSESKFRSLFTSMQEGFALHQIICDEKGNPVNYRFLDVNPAFEKLTGLSANETIGKTVLDLMPATEHIWIREYGKVAIEMKEYRFEQYSDELDRYYRVLAFSPLRGQFATLFEDITDQKKATEEKYELLLRQNAILGAIPDIVMEVNIDKVYTWTNEAGYDFFGADVIGKRADFYFEGGQNTFAIVQPLFTGDDSPVYVESWQLRKDGEKRLLAWWCKTLKNKDDKVIGGLSSARDITENKTRELEIEKSREQLRHLNLYLQRAREEERKLISRELHDQLGQLLTAVKIDLGSLKMWIDDKRILRLRIEKIVDLISESIGTVKHLTSELRPHILDDLGLIAAIEWYASEFSQRTGIKLNLKLNKEIEPENEFALVIFRIFQEAMTNIARHSKAGSAEIVLSRITKYILLVIHDDGTGLPEDLSFLPDPMVC